MIMSKDVYKDMLILDILEYLYLATLCHEKENERITKNLRELTKIINEKMEEKI